MSTSPVNPLLQYGEKLRALPGQALNAVDHPVDTLEGLLGLKTLPPPPQQDTAWHNQMVQQANQSFVDADQQKANAQSAMIAQKFKEMTDARSGRQPGGN